MPNSISWILQTPILPSLALTIFWDAVTTLETSTLKQVSSEFRMMVNCNGSFQLPQWVVLYPSQTSAMEWPMTQLLTWPMLISRPLLCHFLLVSLPMLPSSSSTMLETFYPESILVWALVLLTNLITSFSFLSMELICSSLEELSLDLLLIYNLRPSLMLLRTYLWWNTNSPILLTDIPV